MDNSFVRLLVKAWAAVRAFWLIIGVTLVMLLVVEAFFRVKNAVTGNGRSPSNTPSAVGDPRAAPWYAEFTREYDETRPQRWRPYVYFGRLPSYKGKYIQIDAAGHRVTPQPAEPATPVAKVFLFGGSTMWGDSQRGDHTIAADISGRLQTLAGPGARVLVTNFGETGYVSTQGLLSLILQLRKGNRPDVVLFYDGLNDVGSTVQHGEPGLPQNEAKRVAEFAMGRSLDRTGFARGLGKDLRALALLSGRAMQQLAVSDWVLSKKRAPGTGYIPADSAARSTVRTYVENVRIIEALGTVYGFTPVFVWQPNLHATEKKPNPFEQRLLRNIGFDAFHGRIQQTHRLVPHLLDSAMAGLATGRFIEDAGLFKGDTMAVYTDWLGHNTEEAVPRIVDTFWPQLEAATQAAIARQRSGGVTLPTKSPRK